MVETVRQYICTGRWHGRGRGGIKVEAITAGKLDKDKQTALKERASRMDDWEG